LKLFVTLLLAIASSGAIAADAPVNFLINSAAQDFRAHGPKDVQVRDVYLGYRPGENGVNQYLLCGQFRSTDAEKWQYFATIQTSHYEQWLGAQASALCDAKDIQWSERTDLSPMLQKQLGEVARQP
jgi:hypothetical protein